MNSAINKPRLVVMGVLALVASICMFPAQSKADAIVTIGATVYDVTSVTTSFPTDAAALQAMPWWGNSTKAHDFSTAVAAALGIQNIWGLELGPLFAYELTDGNVVLSQAWDPMGDGASYDVAEEDPRVNHAYATATVVRTPEPGTFSLLFSVLLVVGLFVVVMRYRGNRLATDA